MPIPVYSSLFKNIGEKARQATLDGKNFKYNYPFGKSLKPGTKLHDSIRDRLLWRAQQSREHMQRRYPAWREIDRMCTAYIRPDVAEAREQDADDRTPVALVLPLLYSVRETLLTYVVTTMLDDPMFKLRGTGPEDTLGALVLQEVLAAQCRYFGAQLKAYYAYQDSLTYGTGYAYPRWVREIGRRTVSRTYNAYSPDQTGIEALMYGVTPAAVPYRETITDVVFEGNQLETIDPYLALPDPNVPSYEANRGEYFGWLERSNLFAMLSEETENGGYFNARYLKDLDGFSALLTEPNDARDKYSIGGRYVNDSAAHSVDNLHMFIRLIPVDWELTSSTKPELWVFTLSGDCIVTRANKVEFDHARIPIVSCSPDTDGYSSTPLSRLELVFPAQHAINWYVNSHIAVVKKIGNGTVVVDPSRIDMSTMKRKGYGKVIELKRSSWGTNAKDAVFQFQEHDPTSNHMSDALLLMDLVNRVTGAVDQMQGVARRNSGDVSAQEASNVHSGALSRLQTMAFRLFYQNHAPLGRMMISHTQQFSQMEQYVRLAAGLLPEELLQIYGDKIKVDASGAAYAWTTPDTLRVPYDIAIGDSTNPPATNLQTMSTLYQSALANPETVQQLDLVRIFMELARVAGFKNVAEFRRIQPQIAQEDQVQSEVDRGNLVPLQQGGRYEA